MLRSDTTGDGAGTEEYHETVAVVNATTFHRATKDRFKASQASMTHNGTEIADVNMSVIIFTEESECVIRVLAQWVNESEMIELVLKACARDGLRKDDWIDLLIEVIEFWLRNKLDESVHDRLIDCLIDWLKSVKKQGSNVKNAITTVQSAVENELPWARIPGLKTGSYIVELLACLILYHDDRSLGHFNRDDLYERMNCVQTSTTKHIRTYLLAGKITQEFLRILWTMASINTVTTICTETKNVVTGKSSLEELDITYAKTCHSSSITWSLRSRWSKDCCNSRERATYEGRGKGKENEDRKKKE